MWVGVIQSAEGLKSKDQSFLKKEEFGFYTATSILTWISSLPAALHIADLPALITTWANSLKSLFLLLINWYKDIDVDIKIDFVSLGNPDWYTTTLSLPRWPSTFAIEDV